MSSRRSAKVVHIDLNAYEIAKNHPVDLGMVADPKLTLALLADALERRCPTAQKRPRRARIEQGGARTRRRSTRRELEAGPRGARRACRCTCRASWRSSPAQLPGDVVVFDEALTNSPAVSRYLPPSQTGQYFLTRGGSLGVGFPGGIGVKLANPDKTVLGVQRRRRQQCTPSRRCGRPPATTST